MMLIYLPRRAQFGWDRVQCTKKRKRKSNGNMHEARLQGLYLLPLLRHHYAQHQVLSEYLSAGR